MNDGDRRRMASYRQWLADYYEQMLDEPHDGGRVAIERRKAALSEIRHWQATANRKQRTTVDECYETLRQRSQFVADQSRRTGEAAWRARRSACARMHRRLYESIKNTRQRQARTKRERYAAQQIVRIKCTAWSVGE